MAELPGSILSSTSVAKRQPAVQLRPAPQRARDWKAPRVISNCQQSEPATNDAPRLTQTCAAPRIARGGITLMEVLISMFVLLFGLMGVAAIIPVGNHYVVQGEKFDRGNTLALNAFEELQARGILNPEAWIDPYNNRFIDPNGAFRIPTTTIGGSGFGPGHAFVIDPLSIGSVLSPSPPPADLDVWPRFDETGAPDNTANDWAMSPGTLRRLSGQRWPVRRLTLPIPVPGSPGISRQMTSPVAETIFRLRDDLQVELPERDDFPGTLRWTVGGGHRVTRQYQGNFSWLATVVPLTLAGRDALQPAARSDHPYEVSVVVFYKRVDTPQAETERLIEAEMLPGGELIMLGNSQLEVDAKFENVKSGDWVAVMGVNQSTGAFLLKWYRLLALEEEAYIDSTYSTTQSIRRAMVLGPDWPEDSLLNLRVAIFPGVASVVTREMVLETGALRATKSREVTIPPNTGPQRLEQI